MRLLLLLCSILAASPAIGKEFNVLGGVINKHGGEGASYSGQLEYQDTLPFNHGAWSVSYLNEGHLGEDRRDGYMIQLWGYAPLDGRFTLSGGVGPYVYFNTTHDDSSPAYDNRHGVGIAVSADGSFEVYKGVLFHLRSNWVGTNEADSLSALIGVGCRFEEKPSLPASAKGHGMHEIALLGGQTTVNSVSSEHSYALSVEYRAHLLRHLDWTAGWLYEGDAGVLFRDGAISLVWGVSPLLDDTLSLGVGAGLYAALEHDKSHGQGDTLSGIVGLTASYAVVPHWALRTTWYRVVTGYDGDTDVILGGVGYAF